MAFANLFSCIGREYDFRVEMDKYRRVENSGPTVPKSENEIRITTAGMLGKYVGYAIALLEEKGASSASYQSPLRADQLKPLPSDEYEYEGEDSTQNSSGRGHGRGWATGTSEHVATLIILL